MTGTTVSPHPDRFSRASILTAEPRLTIVNISAQPRWSESSSTMSKSSSARLTSLPMHQTTITEMRLSYGDMRSKSPATTRSTTVSVECVFSSPEIRFLSPHIHNFGQVSICANEFRSLVPPPTRPQTRCPRPRRSSPAQAREAPARQAARHGYSPDNLQALCRRARRHGVCFRAPPPPRGHDEIAHG